MHVSDDGRMRFLIVVMLAAISVDPGPALALDVTGAWKARTILGAEAPASVVQSGTTLDLGPLVGTGTIDAQGAFSVGLNLGPNCRTVTGGQVIGGTRMVGTTVMACSEVTIRPFGAIRCECSDGNFVDGDGCDARCQIEPCFTCAGSPSICTPSADGSACDDRSVCTAGETCTAGVCGSGNPVSPCVDLSGAWAEHVSVPEYGIDEYFDLDIRQIGTILEFGTEPGKVPTSAGTIDPITGVMTHAYGGGGVTCPTAVVSATGTAAPDANNYAMTRYLLAVGPMFCFPFAANVTATRACDGACPTTTTSTSTSTSTTTSTLPALLSGTRLQLKDDTDAGRRGLTLVSKDVGLGLGAGSGSADDPTLGGATLRVRTAAGCAGSCDATYPLPADGWRPLGKPGQVVGYVYADPQRVAGPVTRVTVKAGKLLKVTAKGAGLLHQLTTDPAPVDVVLSLGGSRACLSFGGVTRLVPGRMFVASKAPVAATCP